MSGLRFIDLFAGIGGFRIGMERAGHKSVGWCEIDKFAQKSYRSIHDTEGEWFINDITRAEPGDMPDFDCLCAGFPCQAFSVAGQRKGFEDTRGTLFFEIARIAKEKRPSILFLENVKGLLNHDKGRTFGTILFTLDGLGYDVEWQLLNTKDFGIPQNRERVFIVGHLRGESRREIFPIGQESETSCRQVAQLEIRGNDCIKRVYDPKYIGPSLTTMGGGNTEPKIMVRACLTPDRLNKRQNGRRFKEDGEPMFALTGQDIHGVAISECDFKVRKLTPLECWRLQGQPDENFYKAKNAGLSDSQLYKQAGNSVSIPPVYEIAKMLGV